MLRSHGAGLSNVYDPPRSSDPEEYGTETGTRAQAHGADGGRHTLLSLRFGRSDRLQGFREQRAEHSRLIVSTLEIPDVGLAMPQVALRGQQTVDPRLLVEGGLSELAEVILSLPLGTLMGRAATKSPRAAAAFGRDAANWLAEHPTDEEGNEWLDVADGLVAAKWAMLLNEAEE